jgi:hypothetical protein
MTQYTASRRGAPDWRTSFRQRTDSRLIRIAIWRPPWETEDDSGIEPLRKAPEPNDPNSKQPDRLS